VKSQCLPFRQIPHSTPLFNRFLSWVPSIQPFYSRSPLCRVVKRRNICGAFMTLSDGASRGHSGTAEQSVGRNRLRLWKTLLVFAAGRLRWSPGSR